MAMAPLRVMTLHGFGSCSSEFCHLVGNELVRQLRGVAVVDCVDAPLFDPSDPYQRAWWLYSLEVWDRRPETLPLLTENLLKHPDFEAQHLQSSLDFAVDAWSRGDYDGILGWSQGATMAAVLAAEIAARPELRQPLFVVFLSGFGTPTPREATTFPPEAPLLVPSMHVWGSTDACVPAHTSDSLAAHFREPCVYVHGAPGHCVPPDAAGAVREFLARFASFSGSLPAGGPADELASAVRRYGRRRVPPRGADAAAAAAPVNCAPAPGGKEEPSAGYLEEELAAPGPGTYERLVALLRREGVAFAELGPHAPCRTSEESVRVRLEGGWAGVSLHSGAKAMLLRAGCKEERWLLAVLPADLKLSWKKVRAMHGKSTRMATEEEVREVTGCLPGAVPPMSAAFPTPADCLMDASLPGTINFNCGLRTRSLQLQRADLERVQAHVVCDIAE